MEPLLPLTLQLPDRRSRTLLRDLHQQLRSAILDGRLHPGLRLPSTRSFCTAYGVSRNTAVAAYDLLLSEGYLVARQGSGTRVALTLPKAQVTIRAGKVRAARRRQLVAFWRSARGVETPREPAAPRWCFRLGVPDAESFPVDVWRRLSIRESRSMRTVEGLESDPQGRRALREAIARHVSFTRAVSCVPEDIIVTAGAQQAFGLLARILVTSGRTCVALEDPGYPPLRAAFEAAGSRLASIPVDQQGIVVERLPRSADIVCVTPSHQFPLGCVLSSRRRGELLDFAQTHGAVILEDDYDGEFRFTDRPLDALQTLDRTESVFYAGTFSKSLLPTLRVGFIVSPPWARSALLAAKTAADGGCCALIQGVLAALMSGGHLARHVRKMQRIYQRRRHVLLDILRRDFSNWLEPVDSQAGLHVAARLKIPLSDQSIQATAMQHGVAVRALSAFSARRSSTCGLAFGYGAIEEPGITEGLAVLRRVLSSASRSA